MLYNVSSKSIVNDKVKLKRSDFEYVSECCVEFVKISFNTCIASYAVLILFFIHIIQLLSNKLYMNYTCINKRHSIYLLCKLHVLFPHLSVQLLSSRNSGYMYNTHWV